MSQAPTPTSAPLVPIAPRRRRPIALAVLSGLGGLILGVGLTIVVGHAIIRNFIRHPEKVPERVINRVKHELNLTPEQTAQIAPIIKLHLDAIWKLRQDDQPRVHEQLDLLEQEVDPILTPPQREKWHHHMERFKEMPPHFF